MDTKQMAGQAKEMKDRLEDQAEDAKERFQDAAENWRRRASTAVRNASVTADHYVHDYAWTSLAFAAVLGCVVGFFLGRSRD